MKNLRRGYTTGSCAAAAAQRAAALLLGAGPEDAMPVSLRTPKGISLQIPVIHQERGADWAVCGVQKDSGDDPDVTNGVFLYAKVMKVPGPWEDESAEGESRQIKIIGGLGVGVVTKPGLACPVGEPAINPTPRRMIEEEVRSVCDELSYTGRLLVEISVPQGVELAKRTYNPRLGIEGGISILGTSGIVEPMSEQALIDTIKVEMNVRKALGTKYLILTPGNYGEEFLKKELSVQDEQLVKCSNFIGEALDFGVELGFEGILLTGHLGKLVKVAAGVMNTHSKYGDLRMEVLAAHAGIAGASGETLEKLMNCVTTEEAIATLDAVNLREETLKSLLKKLDFHIKERTRHQIEIGAIIFSNQYGYLGETRDVQKLLGKLNK